MILNIMGFYSTYPQKSPTFFSFFFFKEFRWCFFSTLQGLFKYISEFLV